MGVMMLHFLTDRESRGVSKTLSRGKPCAERIVQRISERCRNCRFISKGGIRKVFKERKGQMTVEFVVIFPVALTVALVACNAMLFISDCASFDRIARNAVRVYATSPGYGVSTENCRAQVQTALDDAMDAEYLDCDVAIEGASGELTRYTATLTYHPNLFGMGMRSEILGVSMPTATHQTFLVVNSYNPGVVF